MSVIPTAVSLGFGTVIAASITRIVLPAIYPNIENKKELTLKLLDIQRETLAAEHAFLD
ncbi:MAG: hypothetical protein WBE58_17455 [Verrucomicrobiales bacterium]